jgi:hypothetical protein
VEESRGSSKALRVAVQEPREPSPFVGPERRVGPVGPRGIPMGTVSAVVPRDCNLSWL